MREYYESQLAKLNMPKSKSYYVTRLFSAVHIMKMESG